MKRILIILMVTMTLCSLVKAQSSSVCDSKVGTTPTTVVGVNTTDTDSAHMNIDSTYTSQGKASFTSNSDDHDSPFGVLGKTLGGGILISIVAIVAVFGSPVFVLFLIFFFRYKNRRARYRLVEQALAAGQPLPEEFIRENRITDHCSQGIRNIFTGIGLFIFLWAITGEFGLGTIGLLIMFMGLGQWLVGYQRESHKKSDRDSNERLNEEEK